MRASGDQANKPCGNLELCAGLKAGIDGATHAMGQQILERSRLRKSVEEVVSADKEKYRENVEACLNNLIIETTGTEEEAAECLETAIGM